jgi:acetyl esterase/lipase
MSRLAAALLKPPVRAMKTARFFGLCVLCGILALADNLAAAERAKQEYTRERGVTYSQPDGKPLKAELYLPKGEGPFPAVLVVHGGAWRLGNRFQLAWVAETLAEAGYAAVAIDYRLAPTHKYPAQIEDCQAAVRWMRENAKKYRIDAERIGGYGYSAGGHLVALLGVLDEETEKADPEKTATAKDTKEKKVSSARLQAVVAGGAPCNFELLPKNADMLSYWLGGTRGQKPDVYRQASPTAHITAGDAPMLFFHGAADALVPRLSPQVMVTMLTTAKVPAKLHLVEKAGHIQAMFDDKALAESIQFFDDRLKKSP